MVLLILQEQCRAPIQADVFTAKHADRQFISQRKEIWNYGYAFACRADSIVSAAIKAVQPDDAVRRALAGKSFSGRILLVAAGKAAWQMAKAAHDCLGHRIEGGVVVTKYDHVMGPIGNFTCCEARQPVPDENAFAETQKALDLVADLRPEDTVLFLLSGGGSALFEKPLVPGEVLQDITGQLLACCIYGDCITDHTRLFGTCFFSFRICALQFPKIWYDKEKGGISMEYGQDTAYLLARLEENSRKQVRLARAQCVFSAVTLVCCIAILIMAVMFVPKLDTLVTQVSGFVDNAEKVVENLNTISTDLAELDLSTMMENMNGLITDVDDLITTTREGLEDTMEKIDKIDFDALNKAIKDLADVIEPLAKFFNGFRS